MKEYTSSIDWVRLACDTDKESTLYQVIRVENEGETVFATDRSRLHYARRSEPYPFAEGTWKMHTGEHSKTPLNMPDGLMAKAGEGYELFGADVRAIVMAAAAAGKINTIPCVVLLPTSRDDGPVPINAVRFADALAGAYHGKGQFYPMTYWAPGPKLPVVVEIDASLGDFAEKRVAVLMPLSEAPSPSITVDLDSYVDARQPVLV